MADLKGDEKASKGYTQQTGV